MVCTLRKKGFWLSTKLKVTNDSVKRRLAFDEEAGRMDHSRSLVCCKLVAGDKGKEEKLWVCLQNLHSARFSQRTTFKES
jgi:hypothetical protein